MALCSGSNYNLDLVKVKWRQHHRLSDTEEVEQTLSGTLSSHIGNSMHNIFINNMSCFPSGSLINKKVMHQEDNSYSDIFSDLEELQLIIQTLCPLSKNIEAAMTNQQEKKTSGHCYNQFICDLPSMYYQAG